MKVIMNSDYGKIICEVIGNYCIKVYVENEESRGCYIINKGSDDNVTDDDLLKACKEIMSREVVVEE
jgi:hypothetical protein